VNKKNSCFKLKINKTNTKDLSGVVVGLQDSNHVNVSMKSIKDHAVALNGKGYN